MTLKEIHEAVKEYSNKNTNSTIMFIADEKDKDYCIIQGSAIDLAANLASAMQFEVHLTKVCKMALYCYENVK